MSTSLEANICAICRENKSKYSCPRCNILYCSVPCYRSKLHVNCSENFYRECVVQDLEQKRASNAADETFSPEMKKMISILKRFESIDTNHSSISDFDISDIEEEFEEMKTSKKTDCEPEIEEIPRDSDDIMAKEDDEFEEDENLDSDDEPEVDDDLDKRLEGINLDNADQVWDKLTETEKKSFNTFVLNGDITKILPQYEPWWNIQSEKKIIEEINNSAASSLTNTTPTINREITPLDKLTSQKPAPTVACNLLNVLAAYAFTVRFFDGDHHHTPRQSASYFYRICGNIKSNLNIASDSDAFEQVYLYGRNEGFQMDLHDVSVMKTDVTAIIKGPYKDVKCGDYTLAALSDLHQLFVAAKNNQHRQEKSKTIGVFSQKYPDYEINDFDLISKSKCAMIIKKIEYYLAFVSSVWFIQ